ncbi:MAG: sensor domain-containing protein [Actinobacteria bacterium]|nr:sensor domain-containing protein [Actinomycetota bacterium]
MEHRSQEKTGFFGVIARPRSYLNLLYLLLGLPLGTLYFTVLVTGFSLGIGLMVLALLGIPILIGLWYVVHAFMQLERSMAVGMVGARMGSPRSPSP